MTSFTIAMRNRRSVASATLALAAILLVACQPDRVTAPTAPAAGPVTQPLLGPGPVALSHIGAGPHILSAKVSSGPEFVRGTISAGAPVAAPGRAAPSLERSAS